MGRRWNEGDLRDGASTWRCHTSRVAGTHRWQGLSAAGYRCIRDLCLQPGLTRRLRDDRQDGWAAGCKVDGDVVRGWQDDDDVDERCRFVRAAGDDYYRVRETIVNSQRPTPNSQPLPTSKSQLPITFN